MDQTNKPHLDDMIKAPLPKLVDMVLSLTDRSDFWLAAGILSTTIMEGLPEGYVHPVVHRLWDLSHQEDDGYEQAVAVIREFKKELEREQSSSTERKPKP